LGRIISSFSYSTEEASMIEEIQLKIKRKGLDTSKFIVKLLKDWYEKEKNSKIETTINNSVPINLGAVRALSSERNNNNAIPTARIGEILESWLPSVVAFEDLKEMAALLAKTQTFEQRLKTRYLDIKTGAAKQQQQRRTIPTITAKELRKFETNGKDITSAGEPQYKTTPNTFNNEGEMIIGEAEVVE
jgi:hypothetical protein